MPPKVYFQVEFEAHILQFRSTHEYFETAKYELQTPTATMFLVDGLFFDNKRSFESAQHKNDFAL